MSFTLSSPNMSHDDAVFDLPPPAYELTQQDLDRKISTAVQDSLRISESQARPSERLDTEGFEVWDEAAYEAAATRLAALNDLGASSSGSGSSSCPLPESFSDSKASAPVEPLRITKRAQPEKERPSWYAEAQLDGPPPSFSRANTCNRPSGSTLGRAPSGARPSPSARRRMSTQAPGSHNPSSSLPHLPEHEADYAAQPPPFSPTGPSLDGPPYEEIVLAYPSRSDSRSPSPLTSPDLTSAFLPGQQPQPQHGGSTAAYGLRPETPRGAASPRPPPLGGHSSPLPARPSSHHSATMPPLSRPVQATAPRPTSAYNISTQLANTTISFDPASAYSKASHLRPNFGVQAPTTTYNASTFYNSAIAATMGQGDKEKNAPTATPAQNYAATVLHKPQPHHAATTGNMQYHWQSPPHTAAAAPVSIQSQPGYSASSAGMYPHHGYTDNSDAMSVRSHASGYGHTHHANSALGSANNTQSFGALDNRHTTQAGSAYAQPPPQSNQRLSYANLSAPSTSQNGSYAPTSYGMAATSATQQASPSAQSSFYSPTPSSAPAAMQNIPPPPMLSPQNSAYTPTSYGSSPAASAPVSPAFAPSTGYGQGQPYASGYVPTTYTPSTSPPSSAGYTQSAQQFQTGANVGYPPAPTGRAEQAGVGLAAQTTSQTGMWTQRLELATAGLQLAGTVVGLMNSGSNSDGNNGNYS